MTRKTWRATRSYTTNGKVCGWLTREYCLDPKHFCDHSLTCARTTWFTQHVVHAWWHWNHSWNINQATHSAFWMVWSRCTTTLYDNIVRQCCTHDKNSSGTQTECIHSCKHTCYPFILPCRWFDSLHHHQRWWRISELSNTDHVSQKPYLAWWQWAAETAALRKVVSLCSIVSPSLFPRTTEYVVFYSIPDNT